MLNTAMPAKTAVAQIVDQYRQLRGSAMQPATLRQFATSLSKALEHSGRRISHQSIKNWGDRRYLPDVYVMLQIANEAQHDWRRDFALDILAAVHPENYEPATEIGREAIRVHGDIQAIKTGEFN